MSALVRFSLLSASWFCGTILLAACASISPTHESEQLVRFPSTDQDITKSEPTILEGTLYRPDGPGPFPAIVLMHSCAGLRDANNQPLPLFTTWAKHLRDQGFVALLVDSYAPRGLQRLCPLPERDRPIKTDRERVRDAYGALIYLQGRREVIANRVGAMGWSNGGQAVLWTVAAASRERPAMLPKGDFQAAISLYPGGCAQAQRVQWSTKIPFQMLIGESDDYTGAKPCADLAATAKNSGSSVDITLFPGAHHAFDEPNRPVQIVKDVVFPDGRSPTAGTNPAARDAAFAQVPAYFRARLCR